jgi:hypothetical protein
MTRANLHNGHCESAWQAGFDAALSVVRVAASVADMSTDPALSLAKLPSVIEEQRAFAHECWEADRA